jgi:hypothetical protein
MLIISLESAIASDKEITESDKKSLLTFASVARYSYAYWHDTNNSWVPSAIDYERLMACDGFGAIFGNAPGAVVASLIDLWFQID